MFPQELTVHTEFPLMTFDRAVNPSWLWSVISHGRAGVTPWYSHMHSDIYPLVTACSAPKQNPWNKLFHPLRQKEVAFPINIPFRLLLELPWHLLLTQGGGDQRGQVPLPCAGPAPPLNSSHFASPIQTQKFCQDFVSTSYRMKSKRIIVI